MVSAAYKDLLNGFQLDATPNSCVISCVDDKKLGKEWIQPNFLWSSFMPYLLSAVDPKQKLNTKNILKYKNTLPDIYNITSI